MSSKRRRFSGEQKAKIALEALRGDRTLQKIAAQYQVHPNQVGAWKRQEVEGLAEVFAKGAERRVRDHEGEVRDLHAKIGELIVERDFFVMMCHGFVAVSSSIAHSRPGLKAETDRSVYSVFLHLSRI